MGGEHLAERPLVGGRRGDVLAPDPPHHLGGFVPRIAQAGQEAGGLGHGAAEIEHPQRRDRAGAQHQAPLQVVGDVQRLQQQLEQRRGQRSDRPHGPEPKADRPAPVGPVGVLGHDHRRQHIVGPGPDPQDEAQQDHPADARREGLGQGGQAQDQDVVAVEPPAALLAEEAEHQGPDRRAGQGRGGQRAGLQTGQRRVAERLHDQRQHQPQRRQVVAVAKDPQPRGQHGAPVEAVELLLVDRGKIGRQLSLRSRGKHSGSCLTPSRNIAASHCSFLAPRLTWSRLAPNPCPDKCRPARRTLWRT